MTTSYSLTLLTSLAPDDPGPCFMQLRQNSNTAFDFIEFLISAAAGGFLHRGDVLICDNAKVHCAHDIQELLLRVVDEWGVQIKFLPTYSPEFNPCELVFALVKNLLRSKIGVDDFHTEILLAFAKVSSESLIEFYRHAIDYLFVHGFHIPPGATYSFLLLVYENILIIINKNIFLINI